SGTGGARSTARTVRRFQSRSARTAPHPLPAVGRATSAAAGSAPHHPLWHHGVVIVITRHTVATEDSEEFVAHAKAALDVLSQRPGYRRGSLARAVDDPTLWTVVTEWDGPGYYRRA